MHENKIITVVYSLVLTLIFAGCGSGPNEEKSAMPEQYQHSGPGTYDPVSGEISLRDSTGPAYDFGGEEAGSSATEMSKEERAGFCAVDVEQESDEAVREKVLYRLHGIWSRDRRHARTEPFLFPPMGDRFKFDRKTGFASLSDPLLGDEEITAKRICVSRPLQGSHPYRGFRVIELMASNNEGVAVFAIRFGRPAFGHSYPTLLMTNRVYFRHGAREELKPLREVLRPTEDGDAGVRIGVYPTRIK